MMYILTGDEKYISDSKAYGVSITNQRKKEDAERRKQGKKTGKRRNKRSHHDKRKDKTMTMKRRAAQVNLNINGVKLQV